MNKTEIEKKCNKAERLMHDANNDGDYELTILTELCIELYGNNKHTHMLPQELIQKIREDWVTE